MACAATLVCSGSCLQATGAAATTQPEQRERRCVICLLQYGRLPRRRVRAAASTACRAVDPRVARWRAQEAAGLG